MITVGSTGSISSSAAADDSSFQYLYSQCYVLLSNVTFRLHVCLTVESKDFGGNNKAGDPRLYQDGLIQNTRYFTISMLEDFLVISEVDAGID